VSGDVQRPRAARLARADMGERLAGFIYGTVVVLGAVVAGAKAYSHEAGQIAALVAATAVVLWLAHVYAHALGHSVAHNEHLSLAEVGHIARREGSIVEAAVPPVAALLLGAFGVISTHAAVWIAFGLGLVVLAVEGIAFARVERLALVGTVAVVALNLSLGALLIGLKLLLTH
jgi:hypothetical protein